MNGIKNNLPDLFPKIIQGANNRRRALRHMGVTTPRGKTLEQVPVVQFELGIDPALRKAVCKIGLALYYKHKGRPATSEHAIAAYWAQVTDKPAMERFQSLLAELKFYEKGARTNVDLGRKFEYRWNENDEGEPDIFVAVIKFGEGLIVCSMIAEPATWTEDPQQATWLKVRDLANSTIPAEWLDLAAQN